MRIVSETSLRLVNLLSDEQSGAFSPVETAAFLPQTRFLVRARARALAGVNILVQYPALVSR